MQPGTRRRAGVIKWYNRKQGFGFITSDSGDGDVFVHRSALKDGDRASINAGDRVLFSIEANDKGPTAVDVSITNCKEPVASPAQDKTARSEMPPEPAADEKPARAGRRAEPAADEKPARAG
ncbi:MAG: cold shock domain-containing protein, partial [Candidatus Lokiarchaeota archaeon]|nr:cold shock domain-containing protein [Candidatus Lokiarchaeota archaeon]